MTFLYIQPPWVIRYCKGNNFKREFEITPAPSNNNNNNNLMNVCGCGKTNAIIDQQTVL